jgi:platelet-activating factor acetylhydrolase IB subunit alpha
MWEVNTGYCKRTYSGHENWVRRICVSKDGETLISGSDDQSVIVWNVAKEAPVLRFFAHDNVIEAVLMI